jgi:hypothetical protein
MLHDCLLQAVIYGIPRDYHDLVDPVILSKNTEVQKYKAIRTDFPVNLGSRRKWISPFVARHVRFATAGVFLRPRIAGRNITQPRKDLGRCSRNR